MQGVLIAKDCLEKHIYQEGKKEENVLIVKVGFLLVSATRRKVMEIVEDALEDVVLEPINHIQTRGNNGKSLGFNVYSFFELEKCT